MFGAKMSGTLWMVGTELCRIGKVLERRKALKTEEKRERQESRGNMLPLGVGRWGDKMEGLEGERRRRK